jgi:hypothetical protein
MIRRQNGLRMAACWLVALAGCAAGVAQAGVQEIVRETQRTTSTDGMLTQVWWMPQQFWEESLKANPAMPAAAREQMLATLSDYIMIAVLRARPGATGLTDVQSKADIAKNLRVEFNGKLTEPVPAEQVSPAAQLLLAQLKPAIAGMAGPVGAAMEFLVYPARVDGKATVDAAHDGSLQIVLYEQTFKWRLPLGSVLPARVDARTGEEFPGNYLFNPFTGGKLTTR